MSRPDWFGSQPIIDFRLRPPYGDLLDLRIWDDELRASFAAKMRVRQAPSALGRSLDLLLAEMDELNVVAGVLNSRADGREGVGSAGNATAAELQTLHPGRFHGFGAVYLNDDDWEREAAHAVAELALAGISIDPGFSRPAIAADDPRVHQLADLCAQLGVPLMITLSVIAGPYVEAARPDAIDRLAAEHPGTTIVVAHACWPYFAEAVAVAFRRPNVVLVPDMYVVGFPGARELVESVNAIVRDQVVFGSAYPSAPIADCIDAYWRLGLDESAAAALFHDNASRILELGG